MRQNLCHALFILYDSKVISSGIGTLSISLVIFIANGYKNLLDIKYRKKIINYKRKL